MKFKTKKGIEMTITPKPNGKGWTVARPTGSLVTVSAQLVDRTRKRILQGEEIPFRSINYTVAIESAVWQLLRDVAKADSVRRVYVAI